MSPGVQGFSVNCNHANTPQPGLQNKVLTLKTTKHLVFKNMCSRPGTVAQVYNPSTLGDRGK